MGLFGGREIKLPPNLAAMMERFGRFEIDPMRSLDDGGEVFRDTQQPLLGLVGSDPAGFVGALADACVPVGGWTVYGADRTVVNLISDRSVADISSVPVPGSPWERILDASNAFLRSKFVPPMRVPGYAWQHFINQGGTGNTWLEMRPPPPREHIPLTPLADGEQRSLIKLAPERDANVVVIRRDGLDLISEMDARYSDDDPTRSRWELKRTTDQYDLYFALGYEIQVWDTADPEMEPFFPTPRAQI